MELNNEEIRNTLPHRFPFLLVDRVLETTEKTIVAIKNVTANEPFFQGHFPMRSVMPGVLMIEAMAQVAGIFILIRPETKGKLAYLTAVDNARIRRAVVPGDQLRIEMEILKIKSRIVVAKGTVKVGQELACEAEIMFSFVE